MAEPNSSSGSKGGKDGGKGGGLNIPSSTPSTSARLPSFRGPRDLTLSASTSATPIKPSLVSRQRKTFSPNIPGKREKNDKVFESQPDKPSKRGRDRGKGGKDGGRGRGRGRTREFIQTAGSLFGDGIAAAPQKRGMMGGYGGGVGGGGGAGGGKMGEPGFLHKPVLNLDSAKNIDKEHEDQKLKEILRDDFIDDPEDVLGSGEDTDLFPVQLPMVRTGRGFKDDQLSNPPTSDTSNIPTIKSEPVDPSEPTVKTENDVRNAAEDKLNIKPPDLKVPMKGGLPVKEKSPELTVAQLLTGKHEELMFIQLPNSLPSHPPDFKTEPNMTRSHNPGTQDPKATSSVDADEEEEKKPSKDQCTLNTLPEGQIGKLKVYKSGKVELWFGNHRLLVDKGTQVGFLQDAASVEVDEENKTGDITVLGHVRHRLVCTPDLEALVKHMKTS